MTIKAPVSQEFLRAFFDDLQIQDSIQQGILLLQLYWQGESPPIHLPSGSSSQVWEYRFPDGQRFALVHQYTNLRGEPIGKPDPKYISFGRFNFYIGEDP